MGGGTHGERSVIRPTNYESAIIRIRLQQKNEKSFIIITIQVQHFKDKLNFNHG